MKEMVVPQFEVPAYDDDPPPLIMRDAHSASPVKSFRLQFTFWLEMRKPEQETLAELIEHLKSRRLFSSTVRDGIRLIADLRAGNLTVLLEMFPWIEQAFNDRVKPVTDKDLCAQLARLEALLQQPAGPRAMVVPQAAAPDDEPVELVIKKAKSDGTSAKNFLESAFNLIQ